MSKIAIYGIGEFGKLFYESLNKNIDYFVDNYSEKKSYDGVDIIKQEQLPKDTLIYISVLQHSKNIEHSLKENGFLNIVNFTDSVQQLPKFLDLVSKKNYLWFSENRTNMLDYNKIEDLKTLLKDKKSKDIVDKMVLLRKTLDSKYYIIPSGTEYFPLDVPILENLKQINFIDCGAYNGDTIEELMRQNKNVGYTLSFEPDENNILKLNNTLEKIKNKFKHTNFLMYPVGVYSSNTILRFSNSGVDSSACFSNSSDIQVPVVALDSVLLSSAPNFIKMDIEGAEKEALLGARKTIKKYKPNLAICLYHKPQDLWDLPLLINQIEPSYDMYIRVHEDMCLSTVLYCIPRKVSYV